VPGCSLFAMEETDEKIFMPANLNALIRYKQIDQCLRNRFADCTIRRMQDACSDALAEYRGVYKLVSERTIRDDIRVMRSEMLGFNAPIVFGDGRYFYSDPDYSIFKTPITEINLLKEVFRMLIKEKKNIKGSEVDELLKKIAGITGDKIPAEKPKAILPPVEKETEGFMESRLEALSDISISENRPFPDFFKKETRKAKKEKQKEPVSKKKAKKVTPPGIFYSLPPQEPTKLLGWEDILKAI